MRLGTIQNLDPNLLAGRQNNLMDYRILTGTYTLASLVEGFREVTLKLQRLCDGVAGAKSDGRQVALFGMQETLLGFGITVHAITGAGLRTISRTADEVIESFANYCTIEGKTQDELLTSMESVWRLSLLTLFHFKLDGLFQDLLRAFGKEPGKTGFGENCTDLLARVTLANHDRARGTLKAATLLRNCLHNNGIHRGEDWRPFTTHGLTYEFRKDYDVQCASCAHILAILDSTVDVLEEILLSSEVRALPKVENCYVVLNP